ncbi:MAG: hypothetical protein V3U16_06705 [Candidatus Neomarinimicrobiota bacterium]
MNKLFIASIAVFFFSCENVPDNTVFPTEPQAGIPGPLAAKGGIPGKPGNPDDGGGGIIGYCVSIIDVDDDCDWDNPNPSYPMLLSPEGTPGKARWPNLTLGWYPNHNNPGDVHYDWIIETSGGPTVAVIPWASITTKKGTVTQLELTLRDFDDPDGLWVSYYGNVEGPFPDLLNIEELKTPEDGLTIHVHQNMRLKKALPKVKGEKTTDPYFGWISIGDIVFDTPCERWPQ